MTHKYISALQLKFLEVFFDTETGAHFFLTGGTALSAFHLQHRSSIDLDLFTQDDLALKETDILIPQLAEALGCEIGNARRTEYFRQYFLEPHDGGDSLKIDLVREVGPQFGERLSIGKIIVDSLENIGANKITAILGRTEAKDFVDLYFILQNSHYDFEHLLTQAQEKDMGLQPFYLAGALLEVQNLPQMPETTPAIQREEIEQLILDLANRLIDRLNPSEHNT
ncbi:MAG: nucleotidyl transferase AbiEii/AbiGii toxin family protein [Chloroflexota bacterium]